MPSIREIAPQVLKDRHRLTARQINSLLGEGTISEDRDEKVRALEMVGELIRIADAFQGRGVEFIPLKGPILSYRLCGDATYRYYRDLDILVDPLSVERAAQLLQSLGYAIENGVWPECKRRQRILLTHTNEISFYHQKKQTTLELHWRLLKVPVISSKSLNSLTWKNIKEPDFAGHRFTVPDDETELLNLVIHGGRHWWRRLKWLVDIKDFLEKYNIDRQRFTGLTAILKAERMVALCNEMLNEYLQGSPLLPCQKPAKGFMVRFCKRRIGSASEPIDDFHERAFQSVWYSLISFPGLRYKLKMIRSYLFVPAYYGGNRILTSLPIFYVYGPVKLIARRLRRR